MRIVHVIAGLDRGGAELALARLLTHPDSRTWMDSTVVCLGSAGVIAKMLSNHDIPVHVLGANGLSRAPMLIWRLYRLLRSLKPDLVQTWMYHADLLGGLVARSLRIPVVWGVRTTSLGDGNARLTVLWRWMCARISPHIPVAVIFVADSARRSHAALGYRPRSMFVIPNGFAIPAIAHIKMLRNSWRAAHGFGPEDQVIGWVGRYNPDKDVSTFVRAVSALARKRPSVRAVMVGRGLNDTNDKLKDCIALEGMPSCFTLAGEQADTTPYYSGFDIFVLSSITEAFPNVVAEAMACALPCVATDVGDVRALIGDAGRIVPTGALDQMTQVIAELLDDAPLRHELGRRARERIENGYSMEATVQQYRSVYQALALTGSTR